MKNGRGLISLIALTLFLLSCKKEREENTLCSSLVQAPVVKVEGPKTAAVNQPITLTVYFGCFSGCGQFGNYQQNVTGNRTVITVVAKYEGCICTQDAPVRQYNYNFTASQTGTYYLKFLQTTGVYLTDTITVQ
jgi:hypothetical protein